MLHKPARSPIRFAVEPRLVPAAKAARRLGLTIDDFCEKAAELRLIGFPAACPVTGNFDLVAIDAWLDQRAGLARRDMRGEAAAISDRLSAFDG